MTIFYQTVFSGFITWMLYTASCTLLDRLEGGHSDGWLNTLVGEGLDRLIWVFFPGITMATGLAMERYFFKFHGAAVTIGVLIALVFWLCIALPALLLPSHMS